MKRILSVVLLGSLACLVALANDAELLTGPSPYFPRKTDCQEFAGVTYDYKQNLFDAKRTYDDAMQKAKTDYENWPNNYKPPHFFGAGVRIGISNSIMTAHKKARERYAEKKRTARTACAAAVKQAEDDMTTSFKDIIAADSRPLFPDMSAEDIRKWIAQICSLSLPEGSAECLSKAEAGR